MTADELARIALRYDTALSRAMLRALRIPVPERRRKGTVSAKADRYAGLSDVYRAERSRWR